VLKRAHGYRCHDVRGNAKYTAEGRIVYTTAALGVVQAVGNAAQEFFQLHGDDVVAMAVHPYKTHVATGQWAGDEHGFADIFVWDYDTQEVYAHLRGFLRGGISCLAFSPSGSKLVAVGQDASNSIAVYDWWSQTLLSTTKTGSDRVYGACWKDETDFMTVDARFVRFHKHHGQNITTRKGLLGDNRGKVKAHLCGTWAFNDNEVCVTGNATGEIIRWVNGKAQPQVAHDRECNQAIYIETESTLMTGGGTTVILWQLANGELQAKSTIRLSGLQLNGEISVLDPDVVSLDFSELSRNILVGTKGAQVFELDMVEK